MADCLYECLKEARLEKYYRNFVNGGLCHCEALLKLSMQDYPRYGVILMEDRLRLFKLIQIVKSVQSEGLVCRHGHSHKNQVAAAEQNRNQVSNRNQQQRNEKHVVHHGRPQPQMLQPEQVSQAQRHIHANNNQLGAPQHVARKSFTQVSYKPHSDSPIFHCRKTLKFTDSDLESSDDDNITPHLPPKQQKQETQSGTDNNQGTSHTEQDQNILKHEKPVLSQQSAIAVSQYLQSVVSQGAVTVQSNGTSLFHQKINPNHNSMQHEHENFNKVIEQSIGNNNGINGEIGLTNNLPGKKLIIDNNDDGMLVINGTATKTGENLKTLAEPKVHVHRHIEKQTESRGVHIANTDKDNHREVVGDSNNTNTEEESPLLHSESNFVNNNNIKQSSEAFFVDVNAPEKWINTNEQSNNLFQQQLLDQQQAPLHFGQSQLFGIQQGHIMYKPVSNQEQQQRNIMMAATNNQHLQQQFVNSHQQQPRAFHFKNFQPSSVIMSGQHSYFPTHTAIPQEYHSSSSKKSHVEKVIHNTGYNYGVPNTNSAEQTNKQPQNRQEQETAQTVPTKAGEINFTSNSKSNSNSNNRNAPTGSRNLLGNAKIKVCVRKRPILNKEGKRGESDIVKIQSSDTVMVEENKVRVSLGKFKQEHVFKFDEVFGTSYDNEHVYSKTVKPLVQCVFNRGSATCFAFGQTGSGKSYTLLGNESVPGLYQLAASDIFSFIEKLKSGSTGQLHLWASYYEIYCSYLFDLLNKRKRLHVRENNRQKVCIAGLMETEVHSVKGLVEVVQYGNAVRVTGVSGANSQSSRSHAILQLEVRDSKDVKMGRMSFIDLAGSERATDMTETSDRQARIEGAEINQSLLALKECIRSLDQEKGHTPYRQSKLTHILRDSFIGNSQTVMIANVSPCVSSCVHTLNTLKYADRVKELKKVQESSKQVSPKTKNMKAATPKLQSVQHMPSATRKTPSGTQIEHHKSHSAFVIRKSASKSEEKLKKNEVQYENNRKSPREISNNADTRTPPHGTPALFLGGQNGMQFASTPKTEGRPQHVDKVSSPFDVSRILREESDTPIRGHKIQRHDTKSSDKLSPDDDDDLVVGPTKLNFSSSEDEEVSNISKQSVRNDANQVTGNNIHSAIHFKHTPGSEHSKSTSSQKSAKIYIGADNVHELIRRHQDRMSAGQEELTKVSDVKPNKAYQIESSQPRVESPETFGQRSRSSGHVLESSRNRDENFLSQRRSRSIERSSKYIEENDNKYGLKDRVSKDKKVCLSPVDKLQNSQYSHRSRSGSTDRYSSGSYPIKSHDEIMAEHREVLDHLDSLLDRAKAAISESPISSARSNKNAVSQKSKDIPSSIKVEDKRSDGELEKPLVSILKKNVEQETDVKPINKSDNFYTKIDETSEEYVDYNKIRHSDPLVHKYSSNHEIHRRCSESMKEDKLAATSLQASSGVQKAKSSLMNNKSIPVHGLLQKPNDPFKSNSDHYFQSEVVVEYEPDSCNVRVDSPRMPETKVTIPMTKHIFGPKNPSERPRPEGDFQRSNSQNSDRESERSASRNMSWHDILSQSNSEPKSKDSSFSDKHHRLSNKNSREVSLEYFEEDKQGFTSKAVIKDLDTVVIETDRIPPETGRSTGDSGISTHRSHDIENELHSPSRGSHTSSHDDRSSIESLGDVSSSMPTNKESHDQSLLNTSIKVKYVSSKKATSRLSLLQDDPDSNIVPPLKLTFDDDSDEAEYISHHKKDQNNIQKKALSARQHEDKYHHTNRIYSARDFDLKSNVLLHTDSNKVSVSSLPIHQDSAFTVLSDNSNREVSAQNTKPVPSYAQNIINLEKEHNYPGGTSEQVINKKVGAVNFSPIQSFPITPRGDQAISVPSVVNKGGIDANDTKGTLVAASNGLVDYLKSEKQSDATSSTSITSKFGTSNQHQTKSQFELKTEGPVSATKPSLLNNQQKHFTASEGSATLSRYNDRKNEVQLLNRLPPNGAHGDDRTNLVQKPYIAVAQTGSGKGKQEITEQKSIQQAKELLMMCHEEQLAQMTSLCKQEMKLLMSVRTSQKEFPEYLRAVEEILSDKGRAILHLKSKIDEYINAASNQ